MATTKKVKVAPAESRRWAKEAEAFKMDIRDTFFKRMAASPVVPWAESTGPVALFAEPGQWWTHGAFSCRDSLTGALYLVLSEVLEPDELATEFMLNWQAELMTVRNVAFTQPYYCRHDYVHARRGEVKPFLKTYYNGLTSLADRQTYTWWEHFFHASPHKTHEEAWWLMQTRWMLWQEHGDTLKLLSCIPRKWMEDGKRIGLDRVASYFGPITLATESCLADNVIRATVRCDSARKPATVILRLPHPQGRRAVSVTGGTYDGPTESVVIHPFRGKAEVIASF